MKAVILAAGKGERMMPLTQGRAKPLLPIANKPLLQHHLENIEGVVDEAIIIVGYGKEQVMDHFGGSFGKIAISYVEQKEQKGTGHAVLQAKEKLSGKFMLIYGDDLYAKEDIHAMASHDNAILGSPTQEAWRFGIIDSDSGKLKGIKEKPKDVKEGLAVTGVYTIDSKVLGEDVPVSPRGEMEFTDMLTSFAQHTPVDVVKAEKYWLPVGMPWDLLDANKEKLAEMVPRVEGEVSEKATLEGPVTVEKGAVVMEGAVVQGPAIIGEGSVIGPNCFVRPHTSIGRNCRVGNASDVKNSILMDNAKVPHQNYVGDSVLGENVNLAAGTKIANLRFDGKSVSSVIRGKKVDTRHRKCGAFIGDNAQTGANVTINPGIKIGANSFVWAGVTVKEDVPSGKVLLADGSIRDNKATSK